jgi:hypothetical protein
MKSPGGRVRARACVTYRGVFWYWLDAQMSSRWSAGSTLADKPQFLRRRRCDGDPDDPADRQRFFSS